MKRLFFVIAFVGIFTGIVAQTIEFTSDRKLRYAAGIIQNFYVDQVDNDTIVDEAIRAMLKTLDPHSAYSTPEETRELNEPLEGNFSGVGIQFNMATDTLYIIQTISGGPSERVGIRPGDRIIMVNDTLIAGVKMKNRDVMKRLRGPKGTTVDVKIMRRGNPGLIDFRITRDDIPIKSIDAAYMVDDNTGYVRISRFAENTAEEFVESMRQLSDEGMKDIIIDLEDNGGGYLNAAYELAMEFLNKGDLIVYTEAPRMDSYYYKAERDGRYKKGRVVVMVNQYSASASEITAGAIQDHDRGVVVGRRTFGKGLVQRPFPFPDGSMIRLTVSRYHTPSGRCIQKPYVKGETEEYQADIIRRYNAGELMSADSIHFPDSLRYNTLRNGRIVYGGGGIMPDRFVPIDTTYYSNYYRDLVAKGVPNIYCIAYVDNHRKEILSQYPTIEQYKSGFEVNDEMLKALVDKAADEGVAFNQEQYEVSKDYIRMIIKALIARDIYDDSSYFRIANEFNPVYKEAIAIINNAEEYEKILKGN